MRSVRAGMHRHGHTTPQSLTLDEAAATTRTGDVWLFRGRKVADRAIRAFTNSPVNHVGMALALDGLPPLLWHAELGRSFPDVWTGERQRGAQLHLLTDAVRTWSQRYGQLAFTRRLDVDVTVEQEDAALLAMEAHNGQPFPKMVALSRRWVLGRFRRQVSLEHLYCAELVALTYEEMGLLDARRPANWYDPGRFWSGDRLELIGASLGDEIEVLVDEPAD